MNIKHCGIYIIYFNNYPKYYLGSSKNITKRKCDHIKKLKKNNHDNIHLQQVYNRSSNENMQVQIIEECNEEDLLTTEQKYFDLMDRSRMLNINYTAGCGPKNSKIITLKHIETGKCYTRTYIEFMQEFGIPNNQISHLATYRIKQSYGFCLPTTSIRKYELLDKNNNKYIFFNIKKFSKENKVLSHKIEDIVNNKLLLYEGWHLPTTTIKYVYTSQEWCQYKNNTAIKLVRVYRLVDRSNKEYEFESIKEFCCEHKLDRKQITYVLRNDISQHEGWHLKPTPESAS